MRDFDAAITRDGTVYRLPWATHLEIIEHFGIPENSSQWRQNYFECRGFIGSAEAVRARAVRDGVEALPIKRIELSR